MLNHSMHATTNLQVNDQAECESTFMTALPF
jgi:hypothetical protein